jgi:hypothetical protein
MYPSFSVGKVGLFVASLWGSGLSWWKNPVGNLEVIGMADIVIIGWFFVIKSLIHSLAICLAELFSLFHPWWTSICSLSLSSCNHLAS